MELESELERVYRAFRSSLTSSEARAGGSGVMFSSLEMRSRGWEVLLEGDRAINENLRFRIPLSFPEKGIPADQCLILGHGFNETDYAKIFPWSYFLCRELGIPVLVFPCAFHLNRRPSHWVKLSRSLYHKRRQIKANRSSSPFNSVASERMSEAPQRFFLGALQSHGDLLDLVRLIRLGKLKVASGGQLLALTQEGAIVHFLGYSLSGYLFLGELLLDGEGLFEESKCVLFNSFAAWDEANPVSVLVVDEEAYRKGTDFYLGTYKLSSPKEFVALYEDSREGVLFRRLFLRDSGFSPLKAELAPLRERLLLVADPHDPIFPGKAIARHLGEDMATVFLTLGRHEFPFNISRTDSESFHHLAKAMRRSWLPAPSYREVFQNWLALIVRFLTGSPFGEK